MYGENPAIAAGFNIGYDDEKIDTVEAARQNTKKAEKMLFFSAFLFKCYFKLYILFCCAKIQTINRGERLRR